MFGVKNESDSRAFPILAGYIFGKNKGERKFAMTVPVTQMAAPVKIEMMALVTQAAVPGGVRVQFVLPEGVTRESGFCRNKKNQQTLPTIGSVAPWQVRYP